MTFKLLSYLVTLQPPCFGRKPKARVATNSTYSEGGGNNTCSEGGGNNTCSEGGRGSNSNNICHKG